MTEVQLIFPSGHLGAVDDEPPITFAMRLIGVAFGEEGGWNSKYGADFENDVFLMKRYCWCERSDCAWCVGCTCGDNTWIEEGERTTQAGEQCGWCRGVHRFADKGALPPNEHPHQGAPNFWHKPSGFRLWWYKYIGRGMQTNRSSIDGVFLRQIFDSHPTGITIDRAIELLTEETDASREAFAAVIAAVNAQQPE